MPTKTPPKPEYVVDFPVLWVALAWIEAHCVIPDQFFRGEPFIPADWQSWFLANHYRVKPNAKLISNGRPVPALGAPAFHYRRSQIVMPQKAGKGPVIAAQTCLEAVGPALFAGWAEEGDRYACREHGCQCGWIYEYDAGEPMGTHWPTPLIQLTAFSREQTDNVYGVLRPMIQEGPLHSIIRHTGEEFIRLPGGGRIDTVTSSNQSRLGQRVTFVPQDEVGIWVERNKMAEVAKTQRRGAAGMGGRTVEITNGWDPAENSVAQQTAAAAIKRPDIFRLHRLAPKHLSYRNKEERRRIHRYVYKGSWWVDLEAIEAEAAELLEVDPTNAERFFGNRIIPGLGAWMDMTAWEAQKRVGMVAEAAEVCGGFDGSESDDWTAIRLETRDGLRFTPRYGPDRRPTYWDPKEWDGSIPRSEVHAAVDEITRRYRLRRFYADPRDWQSEIGEWSVRYGEEVIFEWATYRITQMHDALTRSLIDIKTGASVHDGCPMTALHMENARKIAKPSERYILGKPTPHQKIDLAMADTLAHEAASDLRGEGWETKASGLTRVVGRTRAY